MAAPAVVALFGPTGVGKTAVAVALARLLRERGEDPIAISADALQVYRGLRDADRRRRRRRATELEHRLNRIPAGHGRRSRRASSPQRAHAEIDAARAAGRRPIVVGGTGLYLRAALTELRI